MKLSHPGGRLTCVLPSSPRLRVDIQVSLKACQILAHADFTIANSVHSKRCPFRTQGARMCLHMITND